MERLCVLVLLSLACASSSQGVMIDPRGARPVQPNTRSEKCETQKEWPFCTTDEWGSKCPSGCRIQGLMDKYDHGLEKRIEKIRNLLDQNKAKHRSTDLVSKQTYDYLKEKLTTDAGYDNNYYDLAQNLRKRITDMKIKIDRQLRALAALKERVKDQVVEMQRMEVDIDIKLRSCKGSCSSYIEHHVDEESYVELGKQINQLNAISSQSIETVGTLYVMKSRPLKDVEVSSIYKSGLGGPATAQQTTDVFPEINTVSLVLENEGSSSSPATISKDPGTSYSAATSSSSSTSPFSPSSPSSSSFSTSSSSSSSSLPSKSITSLGGRGDGDFFGGAFDGFGHSTTSHVSTVTTACTKSTRRTVVHTKDGPVEKVEEVMEGGPECQAMADNSKGGLSSLFPNFGHTASASSGGVTTKTVHHAGGTKGAFSTPTGLDYGGLDMGGLDLGGFMAGGVEDDVPDFHARSLKSTRVERQADYVGADCVDVFTHHLNGMRDGLFGVRLAGAPPPGVVRVFCSQEEPVAGWLLVQQRDGGGAPGFNRSWAEYRDGFGSVDAAGRGEFWLGNRNLHLLTAPPGRDTLLRVQLEDWEGGRASAEYTVRVGPEEDGFPLHVSGYLGDAGDALASHSGMRFSTFDRDQDRWGGGSCAGTHGGGWWYDACLTANLNGAYARDGAQGGEGGVRWDTFRPQSLKTVRMSIRPAVL